MWQKRHYFTGDVQNPVLSTTSRWVVYTAGKLVVNIMANRHKDTF